VLWSMCRLLGQGCSALRPAHITLTLKVNKPAKLRIKTALLPLTGSSMCNPGSIALSGWLPCCQRPSACAAAHDKLAGHRGCRSGMHARRPSLPLKLCTQLPAPPRPAYVGSPMRLRIISFSPAETGLYDRGSGPRLSLRPRVACLFFMYSELGRGLPILQKSQQHGVLPEGNSSKRAGRGRVMLQSTDPQHMHSKNRSCRFHA